MKSSLFLIPVLLFCIPVFAQVNDTIPLPSQSKESVNRKTAPDGDVIYTIAEEMPEYPGGENAMLEFIRTNIHYPRIALDYQIRGTVYVNFIIDKSGKITDTWIKRGIGGGCDEEAIRVVSIMPVWNPGKQNGKLVNTIFMLPVKFALQ